MSFLKDHLAPTLHNAIGGLIAAVVFLASGALLTFIKPLRDSVFSVVSLKVPFWLVVLIVIVCILPLLARIRKPGARLKGEIQKTGPDQHIVIHSAHYGTAYAQIDVTESVRRHVRDGTLNILATNEELCGGRDPALHYTKGLTIHYALGGRDRTIQIIEGSSLILP